MEVTLLEAFAMLHKHKSKKEGIYFEITFPDVTRKPRFGKYWHKVMKEWVYTVKDGEYAPSLGYNEKAAASAILKIHGLHLCGNTVPYTVRLLGDPPKKKMGRDQQLAAYLLKGPSGKPAVYECPNCGYYDEIGGFCPVCGDTEMDHVLE